MRGVYSFINEWLCEGVIAIIKMSVYDSYDLF